MQGENPTSKLKRLSVFFQTLSLVFKASRKASFILLSLKVLTGLIPVALLYLTQQLIDLITTQDENSTSLFFTTLTLMFLAILGQELLSVMDRFFFEKLNQDTIDQIYSQVHNKINSIEYAQFEDPHYHNLLHRITEDCEHLPSHVLNQSFTLLQSSTTLLGATLLLFNIHWSIPLFILIAIAPGMWIRLRFANNFHQLWLSWSELQRRIHYIHELLSTRTYAKEMRVLKLFPHLKERFQSLRQELKSNELESIKRESTRDLMAHGFSAIVIFFVCAWNAWLTFTGALTVGTFVMLFQALQKVLSLLNNWSSLGSQLYENTLFLQSFFNFLELEEIKDSSNHQEDLQLNRLKVEQLYFQYPDSSQTVIEKLSFETRRGDLLVVVGDNGKGKSTLCKLLCGLYQANSGSITWHSEKQSYLPSQLWSHSDVVFQDSPQFHFSLRDNLHFGSIEKPLSFDQLKDSLTKVALDKTVQQLPQAENTLLGKEFEGGHELSLGQWQKLALARSFYSNKSICILDEPTNHLDHESEALVIQHLKESAPNKITIIFTHHPKIIEIATKVIDLNQPFI